MSDTTAAAPIPLAAFTLEEIDHLVRWGREQRMEVCIDDKGADYADEVAYIGYGANISPWVLYRRGGALSLVLNSTRSGETFDGWGITVGSVADALALILLNDPGA